MGFALVTFFGELDATFGDEDAAFGQGEGFEAGDDLEEFFELACVVVAAGREFEEAEFELVFGFSTDDLRAWKRGLVFVFVFILMRGDDFGAGLVVFSDAVSAIEFGEAGGAEFDAEMFVDFLGSFFVGGSFFAKGDNHFFGFGREGGEDVGNSSGTWRGIFWRGSLRMAEGFGLFERWIGNGGGSWGVGVGFLRMAWG